MKLAFCLFNYFPYGGLQRDFMHLARFCHAQGHEIHVYTLKWIGAREPRFHLHLISSNHWQNHTRLQDFCRKTQQELTDGRYDVVIGFNKMPNLHIYYAADVCYQARIKESKPFWYRLLPRYQTYLALEKAVFDRSQATEILLISELEAPKYQHYYLTPTERMHLLPPAIQRPTYSQAEINLHRQHLRADYHVRENQQIVLMVGSGFKTKGVDRAIRALAAMSATLQAKTLLWIVGRDDPRPYLKQAKQLQVENKVRFFGARDDVPKFLHAADLLIHPSYHENTGTVILEALTAGLPVLTLATCGYAKYVTLADAGKVLSSPFQQTEFNQALVSMLEQDKQHWRNNALAFTLTAAIYDNSKPFLALIQRVAERSKPTTIKTRFFVPTLIRQTIPTDKLFEHLLHYPGTCFRQQQRRFTRRITLDNKNYFIKQHHGIGWAEIGKNLLQGKLPVFSAKNEWLALNRLQTIGIEAPQPLAYGVRGVNPAKLQSFILQSEISNAISLESFCQNWSTTPPPFALKLKLIAKIAQITRLLHDNGINHRDYYLCHFLLDLTSMAAAQPNLYLIDLHRAQIRKKIPRRWRNKDLAGLYFSSLNLGLTQRDLFRFMKGYSQQSLADILLQTTFWKKVMERGNQLYRKHQGR